MPMVAIADDNYAELTPEEREALRHDYQLRDTHRRIANIRRVYPEAEQTLEEAQAVLATLAGIVRARQSGGEVGLRVAITLAEPAGHVVAWDAGCPLRATG